jgi:hypothetical protein
LWQHAAFGLSRKLPTMTRKFIRQGSSASQFFQKIKILNAKPLSRKVFLFTNTDYTDLTDSLAYARD